MDSEKEHESLLRHVMWLGLLSALLWVGGQLWDYVEGLDFDQSLFKPLVLVPIALFALFFFVSGVVIQLYVAVRFRPKPKLFIRPLLAIALIPAVYFAPIPGFMEGLRDRVAQTERSRLLEFADAARGVKEGMVGEEEISYRDRQKLLFQALTPNFESELSFNRLEPRISISEDRVEVYYGSALTKHWGYSINSNDKCPYERIPDSLCRKVYDNVWVYWDIW